MGWNDLALKLEVAKAEIRQLKDERFGKQSEKQSSTDRSNDPIDPASPPPIKKKPWQQPQRPGPKRTGNGRRRTQTHRTVVDLDLRSDSEVRPLGDDVVLDLRKAWTVQPKTIAVQLHWMARNA